MTTDKQVGASPVEAGPGQEAATDASPVQREQAWLRQRVGAPKEPRLGCSLIAHDRLGFCSACAPRLRDGGPNGDRAELLGWQMLALRQDEVAAATAKQGEPRGEVPLTGGTS